MNMKHCIVTICLFLSGSLASQAQELDNPTKGIIRSHVCEKVGQLYDYIGFLSNPQNSIEARKRIMNKAVRMFIANCGPYEEDGIQKRGVEMEVSSIYNPKVRRRLMKDYFTGLMNMRYQKIDIESYDICNIQVSALRQIDDNTFVCTAVLEQASVGHKDSRPVCTERSRKSVRFYVHREEITDGEEYIIKIGDIKALRH